MLWKAAVMCVWCMSGVPQNHLPWFLSLVVQEMDTIRRIRHFLGTAVVPALSVSMWVLLTALGSHQPELSHRGLQDAASPRWDGCHGGGTCVNGMSSAREEMSLRAVTLCSASCLCLWAEWALQAPQFHVVLSQKVWGWLKADKIHVFIHSWLFTHREAPPVQEGWKHWPVLCPIPRQGSQFAILSVHLWRLLKCEGKEWRFSKVLSG